MDGFLGGFLFGLLLGLLGLLYIAATKWKLGRSIKDLEKAMVLQNKAHAETVRLRDQETERHKLRADGAMTRLRALETSSKGGAASKLETLETALRIASERHPELSRVLPEAVAAAQQELVEVEEGKRRFLPFKLPSLALPRRKADAVPAEVIEEETESAE